MLQAPQPLYEYVLRRKHEPSLGGMACPSSRSSIWRPEVSIASSMAASRAQVPARGRVLCLIAHVLRTRSFVMACKLFANINIHHIFRCTVRYCRARVRSEEIRSGAAARCRVNVCNCVHVARPSEISDDIRS